MVPHLQCSLDLGLSEGEGQGTELLPNQERTSPAGAGRGGRGACESELGVCSVCVREPRAVWGNHGLGPRSGCG